MALDTIPKQEGGKLKAVASGTLPSGQPVVVNADGTVSVVAEIAISQAVGSPTVFESANSNDTSAIFDPNANKVVIAYRDRGNSDYGTAIVGTVSDMSISFGSPVVFETSTSITISATFDSNANKVVIAYEDIDNSNGKAIVGTVSGTSISFGTAAVFASNVNTISAVYDSNAQKVVIAYRNSNNSNYGTAVVGTVSGTSISFGSSTVFNSALTQNISAVYDSNAQKVVIAYRDDNNSDYGTAVVGTVSGTSISFGSTTVFNSAQPTYISATFDSNAQKVVIAYRDQGSYGLGTAIVGTVSGTSISFGTKVVFNNSSGISNYIAATFDSNANKVVIAYRDDGNSEYGTVVAGTVSGTSISFGSSTVFESANSISMSATFDSNANKVVISYIDLGNGGYGTASVFRNAGSEPNLTSENYIGMSGGKINYETVSQSFGSEITYTSTRVKGAKSAINSSGSKIVFIYTNEDNSDYGTAVVGTITGSSISFGSPVVFDSTATYNYQILYDSGSDKFVIFNTVSSYTYARVGTVSGTSISFGTAVLYSTSGTLDSAVYDSDNNKSVVFHRTTPSSARVCTVSGTSISVGSSVNFNSSSGSSISRTVFDSTTGQIVVSYPDAGNSSAGTCVVGKVSGTSISFGSPVVFDSASGGVEYSQYLAYDSNAKRVVIIYRQSSQVRAIVGTVSGTSISFGTRVDVNTGSDILYSSVIFDGGVNKVVFAWRADSPYAYKLILGEVDDTSISFESAITINASSVGASSQFIINAYDELNKQTIMSYQLNNEHARAVVVQNAGTIVTVGQVADGGAATVDIVGTVSTNQSSLTAGQQYFVQTDGTIGETPADPSVLAGTAISATKLIVKT